MDLDDERLKGLGRLAVTAAEVEFYLRALVWELISDDSEIARLAMGTPQFHQLLEVAPPLLVARGLGEKSDQLSGFLTLARAAMAGRNQILHSHWVAENTQVRRGKGKDPGVRLEVTTTDIDNAVILLENAASGLNFMWVEIAIAFGRVNVVDGLLHLPDRTGSGSVVERRPPTSVGPARWAHSVINADGVEIHYPSDPSDELDRRLGRTV